MYKYSIESNWWGQLLTIRQKWHKMLGQAVSVKRDGNFSVKKIILNFQQTYIFLIFFMLNYFSLFKKSFWHDAPIFINKLLKTSLYAELLGKKRFSIYATEGWNDGWSFLQAKAQEQNRTAETKTEMPEALEANDIVNQAEISWYFSSKYFPRSKRYHRKKSLKEHI